MAELRGQWRVGSDDVARYRLKVKRRGKSGPSAASQTTVPWSDQTMTHTTVEDAPAVKVGSEPSLQATALRSENPALARLGAALQERSAESGIQNYSRTYHRHSRSHTRK